MLETGMLRRIFGPKSDNVTGGWRKLRNEELHNLYSLPDIKMVKIQEDGMGGACSTHVRDEKCT
jgi:hypothetical protein